MARSLAIKRSTSEKSKRASIVPSTGPGIPEQDSPKGVLKRQENDVPPTKINSGYRSSPRTSTGSETSLDQENVNTDIQDMDVDVAKTSTQPTTSPRKSEPEPADPPVKSPKSVKTPVKSPKSVKKTPVLEKKTPTPSKKTPIVTPVRSTKRKTSLSPPKSLNKKQKMSTTPAKTPKVAQTPKTPMVKTPPKGQTPNIKTPKDAILKYEKTFSQ